MLRARDRSSGPSRLALAAGGALALVLTACAPPPAVELPPPASPSEPSPPPQAHADLDLPPGAVPIGSDLYMLPLGADEDGCMTYQLHAPRGLVIQAIHYRTPAGAFTLDKRDALCEEEAGASALP